MNADNCTTKDLVVSRSSIRLWYLPAVLVLTGLAWQQGRIWLCFPAFTVMGIACLANAARCGRLHCYVTGPLFLVVALYVLLAAFQFVPMYASLTFLIALGITSLTFIAERSFGTYRGNSCRCVR